MIQTNFCCKCGSTQLFHIPPTPSQHSHIVVGSRVMRTVEISRRVCTQCGYIEEWILHASDLQMLKEEFSRSEAVEGE